MCLNSLHESLQSLQEIIETKLKHVATRYTSSHRFITVTGLLKIFTTAQTSFHPVLSTKHVECPSSFHERCPQLSLISKVIKSVRRQNLAI